MILITIVKNIIYYWSKIVWNRVYNYVKCFGTMTVVTEKFSKLCPRSLGPFDRRLIYKFDNTPSLVSTWAFIKWKIPQFSLRSPHSYNWSLKLRVTVSLFPQLINIYKTVSLYYRSLRHKLWSKSCFAEQTLPTRFM